MRRPWRRWKTHRIEVMLCGLAQTGELFDLIEELAAGDALDDGSGDWTEAIVEEATLTQALDMLAADDRDLVRRHFGLGGADPVPLRVIARENRVALEVIEERL